MRLPTVNINPKYYKTCANTHTQGGKAIKNERKVRGKVKQKQEERGEGKMGDEVE